MALTSEQDVAECIKLYVTEIKKRKSVEDKYYLGLLKREAGSTIEPSLPYKIEIELVDGRKLQNGPTMFNYLILRETILDSPTTIKSVTVGSTTRMV